MRHFADDVLSARGIALAWSAPQDGRDMPLGAETRCEVYLVFKEAVSNVARHSGGRNAEVALGLGDGWLSLRVTDDGKGFDAPAFETQSADGNGLRTMRRRALGLGGTLDIVSSPGAGTCVSLAVPSERHGWARRLLARGTARSARP